MKGQITADEIEMLASASTQDKFVIAKQICQRDGIDFSTLSTRISQAVVALRKRTHVVAEEAVRAISRIRYTEPHQKSATNKYGQTVAVAFYGGHSSVVVEAWSVNVITDSVIDLSVTVAITENIPVKEIEDAIMSYVGCMVVTQEYEMNYGGMSGMMTANLRFRLTIPQVDGLLHALGEIGMALRETKKSHPRKRVRVIEI